MELWKIIIMGLALTSGVTLWFSMIALRLSLDRRVRKALPADKVYDAYPDWYFGIGRAIGFGSASIFDFANRSDPIKFFYDGFDVKGFASTFEKALGWLMVSSLAMVIITSVLYCLLDALGLWAV